MLFKRIGKYLFITIFKTPFRQNIDSILFKYQHEHIGLFYHIYLGALEFYYAWLYNRYLLVIIKLTFIKYSFDLEPVINQRENIPVIFEHLERL